MFKAATSIKLIQRVPLFFLAFFVCSQSIAQQPTGIGIVKPVIKPGSVLYVYSGQLIDELLHHSTIKDSIIFAQGQYNIEISSAPAWFVPEQLKLDYEILQLRAVTVTRNWVEVIVNRNTGQTAWVDRKAVELIYWPDFFLSVYGVELINPATNPARLKPLDNASPVFNPGKTTVRPVAVQGEWMKVASTQNDPAALPSLGWIRWKKDNRLLITWSLLS